ncbi:MAG TPA: histidine kinase [Clostridiaceae bacterium]|nr:histidine kinase [Clostridiaceae bacterium]
MTSALGRLFRLAVNKGGPIVKVKEEIEHVKAYMEIQNFRYNGKIGLVINIDDEEILEYKTLKLILQPIVENAIYHGFEAMGGQGTICIEVYKLNNNLVFDITDNGVGIAQEALNNINRKLDEGFADSGQAKRGIGLINIHQRIEMYFGKGFGIRIKNNENKGTTVTIITPLLKD